MGKYSEVFVAFDVAKKKHAVAIAEGVPAALGLHVGSDGPWPELCGGYERGERESLVDLRQASRPKVVDGRIATDI
jgi:hypothetical protein